MFCKHCGNQIPDDSPFCPKCGTAVSSSARMAARANASASPVAPATPSASNRTQLVQPAVPASQAPRPVQGSGTYASQRGTTVTTGVQRPVAFSGHAATPNSAAPAAGAVPVALAADVTTTGPQASPLRFVEGILALALTALLLFVPFLDLGFLGSLSLFDIVSDLNSLSMLTGSSTDSNTTVYVVAFIVVLALGVLSAVVTAVMTLVVGTRKRCPLCWVYLASVAILVGVILYEVSRSAASMDADVSQGLGLAMDFSFGPSIGAWCCVAGGLLLGVVDVVRGK